MTKVDASAYQVREGLELLGRYWLRDHNTPIPVCLVDHSSFIVLCSQAPHVTGALIVELVVGCETRIELMTVRPIASLPRGTAQLMNAGDDIVGQAALST